MGEGVLGGVERIASLQNGGWRLDVSPARLTSGRGNVGANLPTRIILLITMNQKTHTTTGVSPGSSRCHRASSSECCIVG